MKILNRSINDEVLQYISNRGNTYFLEDIANDLNIHSHEGSYNYMLLGIIINNLIHKGIIYIILIIQI